MAALEPLYLTATSYPSRSKIASSQNLYNLYSENTIQSSPFKAPSLYNISGSTPWITIPNNYNPYYGSVVMNQYLYVVFGTQVYKIDLNKNITNIGTLSTSPGRVRMVENGRQVTILTNSGIAYYYTIATDTFGEITDPDFLDSSSIVNLDGYTIATILESGEFQVSDLRDTTVWSALARATAEALSDNIIAVATYQKQLFFLGQVSTEIWYDAGITAQPFRPINQTFIQQGIIGKNAFTVSQSGLFWVTNNKSIFCTQSFSAKKISTFGIDYLLSKISKPENIIGFSYIKNGHEFINFTSQEDGITITYDVSTDSFQNRGSLNAIGNSQTYWGATDAISFANEIIVPGVENGKLFFLDDDVYTENGRTLTSELIAATLFFDFNRFKIDNLILVMENGVGIPEPDQGSNPLVEMFFSTDGGKNFKTAQAVSIGKEGEYLTQIKWSNLGEGRSFIIKFRITDPIPRIIVGAYYQKTMGGV